MSKFACAAALAALGLSVAAVPAGAVSIIGATQVHVTSADATYLQIAELLAFDIDGDNVAFAGLGGSVAAANQYDATTQPSNAIDGLFPRSYADSPGIYHSAGTPMDFLNVFFAAPANLSSLTIYGRTDCCAFRDLYDVTIRNAGNQILYSGQLDARTTGSATVTFDRAAAIPEPATWALLLAGFGGAGALLRRYRSPAKKTVAAV